jgi:hypothetical protein
VAINNCRGEVQKERIVREFALRPVLHVKLLPGQEIRGCCGLVTDRYYHFEAVSRANGQCESFSVGYDCAEQFLERIGHAPLPLFNPLWADGEAGLGGGRRGDGDRGDANGGALVVPLNRELSVAIHVLFIAWRSLKPGGPLTKILNAIRRSPGRPAEDWQVRSLNTIVGKDAQRRTLRQIVADLRQQHPTFRDYEFPNIEAALRRTGVESLI